MSSSEMGWRGTPQYNESRIEMDKIQRRNAIRRQLKSEFNRLYYNPYRHAAHVEILDPAVQRFMSMRASYFEYWKPSWRSFFSWISLTIGPIWLVGFLLNMQRNNFDKKCRTGEIRVEKRGIKAV